VVYPQVRDFILRHHTQPAAPAATAQEENKVASTADKQTISENKEPEIVTKSAQAATEKKISPPPAGSNRKDQGRKARR